MVGATAHRLDIIGAKAGSDGDATARVIVDPSGYLHLFTTSRSIIGINSVQVTETSLEERDNQKVSRVHTDNEWGTYLKRELDPG